MRGVGARCSAIYRKMVPSPRPPDRTDRSNRTSTTPLAFTAAHFTSVSPRFHIDSPRFHIGRGRGNSKPRHQPTSIGVSYDEKNDRFCAHDKLDQTLEIRWAGLLEWPRRRRYHRSLRYVVSLTHRLRLTTWLAVWRFAGKLQEMSPDSRAAQSASCSLPSARILLRPPGEAAIGRRSAMPYPK